MWRARTAPTRPPAFRSSYDAAPPVPLHSASPTKLPCQRTPATGTVNPALLVSPSSLASSFALCLATRHQIHNRISPLHPPGLPRTRLASLISPVLLRGVPRAV